MDWGVWSGKWGQVSGEWRQGVGVESVRSGDRCGENGGRAVVMGGVIIVGHMSTKSAKSANFSFSGKRLICFWAI